MGEDGCSGRLSKLLDSGSVVLKPWAPPPAAGGYPFFYRALKPWTHFVPIEPVCEDSNPQELSQRGGTHEPQPCQS